MATRANQQFLAQSDFPPWTLTTTDPARPLAPYLADGRAGYLIRPDGTAEQRCEAGLYKNNTLLLQAMSSAAPLQRLDAAGYRQSLDMRTGVLTTTFAADGKTTTRQTRTRAGIASVLSLETVVSAVGRPEPPALPFWNGRDVLIQGDAEAQQVTHANLFYLLSSTYPGSDHSIPPMGLSSNAYGGHIFWDADVWMLPALIAQYPEYARSIVDYRFKTLAQARKNARAHGYKGAEYPWESAATGAEVAPPEFAQERHITADVAFAAWQYYLWTGDKAFLAREDWPLLQATAQYWVSRVTRGSDGKYHILRVLSPDETAGVVDDDAFTNDVVRYNLRAALAAARALGKPADPHWATVAEAIAIPFDKERGFLAPHAGPLTDRFAAKQADTLLLLYPLNVAYDPAAAGKMLDFYAAHTIPTGPAMTASIHAVIAARLGRKQQALDDFRAAYRPFMRAPWDAFSEKRTTQNVYFLTGMAGCVQSVLYGFAGLRVTTAGEKAVGTKLAGDSEAALYADPHLPPSWEKLQVQGIRFRGKTLDLTISGDKINLTPVPQSR